MRILIIGAVAAGTSAGAKARRNNEEAEIVIYEKDTFISYSGCGMPYYIGGVVENAEKLTPRDPAFFLDRYNIDVLTGHEVLSINPDEKTLNVKNLSTGEEFIDKYDKLVIATGASAVVPPIKGTDRDNVFTLRTVNDMYKIKTYLDENDPKSVVIVGTGFVGLEMCENLKALGLDVTMVEMLTQVTPGLDSDMASYLEDHLVDNGVEVLTNASAAEINDKGVLLSDGRQIEGDFVLLATGVRPNTKLAEEAGVELGETKAIKVDERMRTNIEDIYSCGDCIEQFSVITGKPIYRPLGSTANKTGRITGDSMTGGPLTFRGILGTGIFEVFGMAVAQTGLSEREAKAQGFDVAVIHNIKPNKPDYMGGEEMVIKAVADKDSGRLIGVQIVGSEGVDKRIDVFITAITFKATVDDLFHLDLAYAPQFSTTKDPVMYTGMILDNVINRDRPVITVEELEELIKSGKKLKIIDTRKSSQFDEGHVDIAENIPHEKIRYLIKELDTDTSYVTYCNRGTTGNAVQNILLNNGFKEVYNLSGGHVNFSKNKGHNHE